MSKKPWIDVCKFKRMDLRRNFLTIGIAGVISIGFQAGASASCPPESAFPMIESALESANEMQDSGPSAEPLLDDQEREFFRLINEHRTQHGIAPLALSSILIQSSKWMSKDMAESRRYSHVDSLRRFFSERMRAFGYKPASTMGENLTVSQATAQAAFDALRTACDPDSTGKCTYDHNRNMLDPSFKEIGIGHYFDPNSEWKHYWTTDFGTLAPKVAEDEDVPKPKPRRRAK